MEKKRKTSNLELSMFMFTHYAILKQFREYVNME